MELVYMSTPHYDAGRFFLMTLANQNNYNGVDSNLEANSTKLKKDPLQASGSCLPKNPAGGKSKENGGDGGSSSDEDELSTSALSNCISIIDNKRLTRSDVSVIHQVVARMVEFASYQAAIAMSPGIISLMENYQERIWASEFDKMEMDCLSQIDTTQSTDMCAVPVAPDSSQLGKQSRKVRKQSRKIVQPSSRGTVKKSEDGIQHCFEKNKRPASCTAKPTSTLIQSSTASEMSVARSAGQGADITIQSKSTGAVDSLQTTQLYSKVALPPPEDPPHGSSNEEDDWPATHTPSGANSCGIRRPRLLRRPVSAEKHISELQISGCTKPLHLGEGSQRTSDEGSGEISKGGWNSSQSCPASHHIPSIRIPVFGSSQNENQKSCGAVNELSSTTVINALQSIENDREKRVYTARGEGNVPLYSQNGQVSRGGGAATHGFPVRQWIAAPGGNEVEGQRLIQLGSKTSFQPLITPKEGLEEASGSPSKVSKGNGVSARRRARRKPKTRHRRSIHRQSPGHKEMALGLEPLTKDRQAAVLSLTQSHVGLSRDQVAGLRIQQQLQALNKEMPVNTYNFRPKTERSTAPPCSSRSPQANFDPMTVALKNQCYKHVAEFQAGGSCSDGGTDLAFVSKSHKQLPDNPEGNAKGRPTCHKPEAGEAEKGCGGSRAPPRLPSAQRSHRNGRWDTLRMALDVAVSKRLREISRLHTEASKPEFRSCKNRR